MIASAPSGEQRRKMPELPLVAYANRLPVQRTRAGWRVSSGGLTGAIQALK